MKPKLIPADFETAGIEGRPVYPPVPVGVAIRYPKWQYLAWGHPTENNCTKKEAKKILKEIWADHIPIFHNAAFDLEVALEHMGLKYPKHGYHDTLFLAYLHDPRDKTLSLKPLAEKYLEMPPNDQLRLKNWILKNVFEPNGWKETKKNPWGKYICLAPGKLVGKYAISDIKMTWNLYNYMLKEIKGRS